MNLTIMLTISLANIMLGQWHNNGSECPAPSYKIINVSDWRGGNSLGGPEAGLNASDGCPMTINLNLRGGCLRRANVTRTRNRSLDPDQNTTDRLLLNSFMAVNRVFSDDGGMLGSVIVTPKNMNGCSDSFNLTINTILGPLESQHVFVTLEPDDYSMDTPPQENEIHTPRNKNACESLVISWPLMGMALLMNQP